MKFRNTLLALKGMGMGIAEVIPGVSGGTIAFVTGIYERLLEAIRSVDLLLFRNLLKGRLKAVWEQVDGAFLAVLFGGMAMGVVVGVFGISYLMEHQREILYAFFFGLIIASAWYIGRKVDTWSASRIVALVAGLAIAYFISRISPAEGSVNPVYLFVSGFLAVSALMLPGISGSFILLLMGMYPVVLGAVRHILGGEGFDTLWILLCFIAGMAAGLIIFSRILTWMFHHYHELTLALLAGFMIGSLSKIWPWRIPVEWLTAEGIISTEGIPGEHARILVEKTVLPKVYTTFADPHVAGVVLSALLGIAIIAIAVYLEQRVQTQQQTQV